MTGVIQATTARLLDAVTEPGQAGDPARRRGTGPPLSRPDPGRRPAIHLPPEHFLPRPQELWVSA